MVWINISSLYFFDDELYYMGLDFCFAFTFELVRTTFITIIFFIFFLVFQLLKDFIYNWVYLFGVSLSRVFKFWVKLSIFCNLALNDKDDYRYSISIYFDEQASWQSGYVALDLMMMSFCGFVHYWILVSPKECFEFPESTSVYQIFESSFLSVCGVAAEQSLQQCMTVQGSTAVYLYNTELKLFEPIFN